MDLLPRLLLSFIALALPAAAGDTAHLRPKAVVPMMTTAPTIDGTLAADEWRTMHVLGFVGQKGDRLQPRHGEFWLGCDGKRLYVAVRSAVHPTAGATAKYAKREAAEDVETAADDDSVEVYIAPLGENGQTHQIVVTTAGAVFDQRHQNDQAAPDLAWTADLVQAHTVKDGVWTAELSIGLDSLGITDAVKLMAIRVTRNYTRPYDQSRWAPGVSWYTARDTMPRVLFMAGAPIVSEVSMQDDAGIRLAIDLTNPGIEDDMNLVATFTVRTGDGEDRQEKSTDIAVTLKPGETKRITHAQPFPDPLTTPVIGEIQVKSTRRATYYHRDFSWVPRSPDAIWDSEAE